MFKRSSVSEESPVSIRDRILGAGAAFSALYCVAVSFMLSHAEARKRFFIALAIFIFCFFLVKQKKGVAVGVAAFVAIRIVWGLVATSLQGGKFW
jgi:hypothetical protein